MPHRIAVLARTVLVVVAFQCANWSTKANPVDQAPLPNTLTEKEQQAGWILLFDGRTLAGWRASERGESFTVRDGMIVAHCRGTGDPGTGPSRQVPPVLRWPGRPCLVHRLRVPSRREK